MSSILGNSSPNLKSSSLLLAKQRWKYISQKKTKNCFAPGLSVLTKRTPLPTFSLDWRFEKVSWSKCEMFAKCSDSPLSSYQPNKAKNCVEDLKIKCRIVLFAFSFPKFNLTWSILDVFWKYTKKTVTQWPRLVILISGWQLSLAWLFLVAEALRMCASIPFCQWQCRWWCAHPCISWMTRWPSSSSPFSWGTEHLCPILLWWPSLLKASSQSALDPFFCRLSSSLIV